MALLTLVLSFENRREVHVHELGSRREAASDGDLNTAFWERDFGRRMANPDAERVSPKVLDEVLQDCPLGGTIPAKAVNRLYCAVAGRRSRN